jgi:hypothetical protein
MTDAASASTGKPVLYTLKQKGYVLKTCTCGQSPYFIEHCTHLLEQKIGYEEVSLFGVFNGIYSNTNKPLHGRMQYYSEKTIQRPHTMAYNGPERVYTGTFDDNGLPHTNDDCELEDVSKAEPSARGSCAVGFMPTTGKMKVGEDTFEGNWIHGMIDVSKRGYFAKDKYVGIRGRPLSHEMAARFDINLFTVVSKVVDTEEHEEFVNEDEELASEEDEELASDGLEEEFATEEDDN